MIPSLSLGGRAKHRATILISPRGLYPLHTFRAAALWPSRENLQSFLIVSLNSFLLNESNLNQFSSLKSRLTFIFIVLEESLRPGTVSG